MINMMKSQKLTSCLVSTFVLNATGPQIAQCFRCQMLSKCYNKPVFIDCFHVQLNSIAISTVGKPILYWDYLVYMHQTPEGHEVNAIVSSCPTTM